MADLGPSLLPYLQGTTIMGIDLTPLRPGSSKPAWLVIQFSGGSSLQILVGSDEAGSDIIAVDPKGLSMALWIPAAISERTLAHEQWLRSG